MDWMRAVDNYCERTDPGYWAEPLNAMTNAAFVLAALVCWRRLGDRRDPGARMLCAILALIGVGSYLFHTHARVWAAAADVLPILGFILAYLYLATVRLLRLPVLAGLAAAAAYVPASAAVAAAIGAVTGPLNGSVSYLPVVLAIAAYAALLWHRGASGAARGLALGAGLLSVSLAFRSVDAAVCPALPLGTHFVWHLLNALMLGWMIAVLARHGSRGLARTWPGG